MRIPTPGAGKPIPTPLGTRAILLKSRFVCPEPGGGGGMPMPPLQVPPNMHSHDYLAFIPYIYKFDMM